MKKFLSLVLALVMTMSLVTISAGAKDFADDSKLNYKEAVDVMSAIGVIDGYTDGSFNPQGGLTRGAAAKIICNLILGPTTAAALHADTAPYKDVPVDHTFAGYIAYCAQQGIIDGYSDGTFRPAAPLTGYAFMKFLLGSLGYDKDIEGYNGPNWSIQVAKRALAIGLDDGMIEDFVGAKAVNREEACLFAFNTLTADMVEYGQKTTITVGGAEVVVGAGEARKVGLSDSKDYRETVREDDKDDGYLQFCEKYFSSLKLNDKSGITDEFGRPSNTWYKKSTKIGTYPKTADATYTEDVEAKEIYADLDLSDPYVFTVIANGEDDEGSLPIIRRDGQLGGDADDKVDDAGLTAPVGNGSLIQVFKDEKRITVINTYLLQVAADYDEKDEELELETVAVDSVDVLDYPTFNSLTLTSDDFAGLEEYKEDDYVIVTVADGDIQTIAPVEAEVATVTEYVHEESVTAGGQEYEYSAANVDNAKAYSLKDDYKLFLDPYGFLLWADGVKADDQYVFIYEFSKHSTASKGAVNAYAYFTDGTEAELTVTKLDGTKVYGNDIGVDGDGIVLTGRASTLAGEATGWFKYVEKDGKYELTSIDTEYNQALAPDTTKVFDYSVQHTVINDGVNTPKKDGNKSTIVLVLKSNGDVAVYEGIKNVPDITSNGTTVVDTFYDGSYAKCVFVELKGGKTSGGSNSADRIFFYKNDKYANDTDDDNYYIYKAIVNGKETKVKVEQTADNSALRGLYTGIEYNKKNFVVDYEQVTGSNYPVSGREDFTFETATGTDVTLKKQTLIIGSTDYFMADECAIFVIDGSTVETVSATKLAKDDLAAGTWSIAGVLNGDAEYTELYIYK